MVLIFKEKINILPIAGKEEEEKVTKTKIFTF